MNKSLGLLMLLLGACATNKIPSPKKISFLVFTLDGKSGADLTKISTVIKDSIVGCPDLVLLSGLPYSMFTGQIVHALPECGYVSASIGTTALLSKMQGSPNGVQKNIDLEFFMDGTLIRTLAGEFNEDSLNILFRNYIAHQSVPTLIAGTWDPALSANFRSNFFNSDELIGQSSMDQGNYFETAKNAWTFSEHILIARNAFDQVECRVSKSLAFQSDRNGRPVGGRNGGVSTHFPVLCTASF